jgi:hypothetical protein
MQPIQLSLSQSKGKWTNASAKWLLEVATKIDKPNKIQTLRVGTGEQAGEGLAISCN